VPGCQAIRHPRRCPLDRAIAETACEALEKGRRDMLDRIARRFPPITVDPDMKNLRTDPVTKDKQS